MPSKNAQRHHAVIRACHAHQHHQYAPHHHHANQHLDRVQAVANSAQQHRRDAVGEQKRAHQQPQPRRVKTDAQRLLEFSIGKQRRDADLVEKRQQHAGKQRDGHRPAHSLLRIFGNSIPHPFSAGVNLLRSHETLPRLRALFQRHQRKLRIRQLLRFQHAPTGQPAFAQLDGTSVVKRHHLHQLTIGI
jgi:hypothetical protein